MNDGSARRASAGTRLTGVIGWPVAHSLSPAMHEAAYAALDLPLCYLAFPVEPRALGAAIAGASALGVVGLNVTVPHKEAVLPLCRPDDLAARVGAVNTLCFAPDGGPPVGRNTDVHGVRQLLIESGVDARGRSALVLGAGGAARAAAFALVEAGARVVVAARTPRAFGFGGMARIACIGWSRLGERLPTTDLLVDATGRGLDPSLSLDLSALPPAAVVLDLVVRRSTRLCDDARARGLRAETGDAMLLHQGAEAFAAWPGREAPLEVRRAALGRALDERAE